MTLGRAKVVRRLAEHVIHIAKEDTVFARRRIYDILTDRDLVMKLFKEIAPLSKDRVGGYTRILTIGTRRGDGAQMAFLELTDKKIVEKISKKKSKAKAAKAEEIENQKQKAHDDKLEDKKDESKVKHISKAKPTLDEEKAREKARNEEKKMADKKQGFMKNIRGLFRKRGDF